MSINKHIKSNIYLRALEIEDINNNYLEWINDSKSSPFLLSSRRKVSLEDLKKYYEMHVNNTNNYLFAICDKATNSHIGNARLYDIDTFDSNGVFGWLIGDVSYRGRGLGTESLIQLFKFGFQDLNLNRIYGKVALSNLAALRSCEKAGLIQEGICHESFFSNGKFHDAAYLRILKSEFSIS